MKKFKLIDEEVALYFSTARERYRVMHRKQNGDNPPWSNDEIFNSWFFCNVFREDDKVTKWIKEHVREPNRNCSDVVWMMVACRLFNRIPTLEKLRHADVFNGHRGWDRDHVELLLEDEKPLTGAAYMVHTPYGMDKLRGCLKLIDDAVAYYFDMCMSISPGVTTQQEVWEMFLPQDCFGPFMAYEVVTDLKHTYLLENAPDTMTWASIGPGAALGLSRLVGENVSYGSASHRAGAIECMKELLEWNQTTGPVWPGFWPKWDMRTVEHWLCEHSKWCRVQFEDKRMKRKYPVK